jgi:hypothetical protein
VVRYLAGEAGVSQFLDIGTGIPAPGMDNTQEVAQGANPASRIVYADNDPIVLAHAQALLASTREGAVAFIQADLHDPAAILARADTTLDLAQPVAVMLLAVLHVIEDEYDRYAIVGGLMDATAPGSYLVISHPASDLHAGESARGARRFSQATGLRQTNRDRAGVTRFFDGLEITGPGIVPPNHWRAAGGEDPGTELSLWAGVARKP